MKIYEFDFEHKKEWIVAEDKESAKELVVDIDMRYQDLLDAGEVSIRELQGYELDRIVTYDTVVKGNLPLREILAQREMDREEMPFHLGGEYNPFTF